MQTPDIPLPNWTRETGYPIYRRIDGNLSVDEKFYVDADYFDLDDLETLETVPFLDLFPSNVIVTPNENQSIVFITFSYTRPSGDGVSTSQDGVAEYTLEDSGQQIPVDRQDNAGNYYFTNYRAHWNHHVVGPKETEAFTEAQALYWETAQNITTAWPGDNGADIRWVKEQDSYNPDTEKIFRKATKSAVEYYLAPSPVVVETRKYRTYTAASAAKSIVGIIPPDSGPLKRPKKDFNILTESGGRFLVVSSGVTFDGRRWQVQTRYQWAPAWDTDLYQLESF